MRADRVGDAFSFLRVPRLRPGLPYLSKQAKCLVRVGDPCGDGLGSVTILKNEQGSDPARGNFRERVSGPTELVYLVQGLLAALRVGGAHCHGKAGQCPGAHLGSRETFPDHAFGVAERPAATLSALTVLLYSYP